MKFKVLNSKNEIIETVVEKLENNRFDNLLFQPKKSGNYSHVQGIVSRNNKIVAIESSGGTKKMIKMV